MTSEKRSAEKYYLLLKKVAYLRKSREASGNKSKLCTFR